MLNLSFVLNVPYINTFSKKNLQSNFCLNALKLFYHSKTSLYNAIQQIKYTTTLSLKNNWSHRPPAYKKWSSQKGLTVWEILSDIYIHKLTNDKIILPKKNENISKQHLQRK
jgi:hypothetical protein